MSTASPTSSGESSRRGSGTDVSGGKVKRFLNGWTKEQENLMAQWADIASCYRWLHDRSEKKYSRLSMTISIPVIILSTLTGAANFAVGSFIPPDDTTMKNYVSAALGGLSIGAGILTTLGNFFQYAQKSESNRVAGIAWGKFQRLVSVELAINPTDRLDAMDFLQICRQDLDRLIEQSPPISDDVIKLFEAEFKEIPNLKMPDICHGIEHTRIFDSSKSRLSQIAADATLHLRYKKNILAKSVIPDIDRHVEKELNSRIESRIRELLPAPVVPDKENAEAATKLAGMEKNWRRLLTSRRNLLDTGAQGSLNTSKREIKINLNDPRPEDIRINIVGSDGSMPRTPGAARSVTSRLGSRTGSVASSVSRAQSAAQSAAQSVAQSAAQSLPASVASRLSNQKGQPTEIVTSLPPDTMSMD